ncbi:hypothetical protein CR513_02367, partial [Mucuna pruriens]
MEIKRYILTFIDDLSRKVWVYFPVENGEALDVFKKFKALVEKQADRENTPPRSLLNFVMSKVFKDNSLHLICHIKMA